jgi:hypothetical protein
VSDMISDPELLCMVGGINLEDYEGVQIGDIEPLHHRREEKEEGSDGFAGGSNVGPVACLIIVQWRGKSLALWLISRVLIGE